MVIPNPQGPDKGHNPTANQTQALRAEQVNQDFISNFIDSVRLEQAESGWEVDISTEGDDVDLHDRECRRASTSNDKSDLEQAQARVDRAIVEAEKFRATIADPGNNSQFLEVNQYNNDCVGQIPVNATVATAAIPNIGAGVSDDDFFHLTCHIDPSLIHKIEKGEFVELEKLLPKDKVGWSSEESRLEWVQHDGSTFLVPAQKDNKIGSFRRWEQAFRAYATIYCGANPHRSKEIWQYITVINTAASSYLWDNVYNYDITFRHLMAFNPSCSWMVTYNQMWNLSMREPIPKKFWQ